MLESIECCRVKWSAESAYDRSFDLERFVVAQAPAFETVLDELRRGRKRSHWM